MKQLKQLIFNILIEEDEYTAQEVWDIIDTSTILIVGDEITITYDNNVVDKFRIEYIEKLVLIN